MDLRGTKSGSLTAAHCKDISYGWVKKFEGTGEDTAKYWPVAYKEANFKIQDLDGMIGIRKTM